MIVAMTLEAPNEDARAQHRLTVPVAASAALLALLSASCCILPVALSIVGLGGAWLSVLGPFVAYREFVLAAVALALLWGWIAVLRRGHGRMALVTLTVASLVFLIALSAPLWERDASQALWAYWMQSR